MLKIIKFFILLVSFTFTVYSQWIQLTSPTSSTLYSVNFLNTSTGFLNGALSGSIIKTSDGGTSWSFTSSGTSSTFYDIAFYDNSIGVAVGSNGTIIKTSNGGTNWGTNLTGSSTFNSVSIVQPTIGYAVGGTPSSFFKTTDAGSTWSSVSPPTNNPIRCTQFFNGTYGYICGYSGLIMKTTDGGISWMPQTQASSYNFEKIYFLNLTVGYVIGSSGVIMKTTDGGSNWVLQSSGVTSNLYDMDFKTLTNGWVVGASGNILETTDGGSNWYPQSSPSSSATFYSIKMIDLQTGYIGGSGGILLKTTNGGGPLLIPMFQKVTSGQIVTDLNSSDRCAWGDYDNDGYIDLVVSSYNDNSQSTNYPLLLYHNNGDGTFTRVTTGPIANYMGKTFGVAWGDYDNDGRLDLFVCVEFGGNNLLFHNEGNGNFTQITTGSIVNDGGSSECCSWCDYDKDGWIDLFVGNNYNENNFLYHNNGNGTFTKVTTGSIVNDGGYSRGSSWGDYDNDGWPDLFVVNYQGENDFLYHNNGNGTFTRINTGPEVNDGLWGSGCTWGDYDNDGRLDLYVTNTTQGGRLYHNDGNGNFSLVNNVPSNDGGLLMGTSWGDYDNDGFIDLFAANESGYGYLYHNNGNGTFSRVTNEIVSNDYGVHVANAWGDYNNDGKLDLFVTNTNSVTQNFLYRNTGTIGTNLGNYLTCKLHGCMPRAGYSNTCGIGAKIKLYSGTLFEMKEVTADNGMGSEDMLWPHFGLGSRSNIDSLVVYWPSGLVEKMTNVTVNQILYIDECLVSVQPNTNQIPYTYSLAQNYPNPFNPITKIYYQIPKNTFVTIEVFDYLGRKVTTLTNTQQPAGYYQVDFNGENHSSGVYFYKITAGDFIETKKMILIK